MPARRDSSTTSAVRIRRAVRSDLAALVDLENRTFASDRMSARQMRHHLDNASAGVLVAVSGGEVVGSAVVFLHPRHRSARLYSIAVSASARGLGVGKRLLEAAERMAGERGRDLMRLEVRNENAAARSLYEQQGYRHFGRRKRYYEDGHDAERYQKTLGPRGLVSSRARR
ncbi:MAG: ribosomal protein S18-alanine N-acetyltransferase [Rhodanobacteraceae bacterium]